MKYLLIALLALFALFPDTIPSINPAYGSNGWTEDGSYYFDFGSFSVTGCSPLSPWNGEWSFSPCLDR
jgi:hypothetical protein